MFIKYPDWDNPRFLKKFRLKFRIPLDNFEELAASLEDEAVFRRWHCNHHGNADRVRSAPIPLLLLTSLQYMGCALTLDDLEELCWTDGHVIRVFLHVFLKFGRTDLYERYIRTPATTEDAAHHTAEYKLAGFPGAIGSTDAAHIQIERLQARFKNSHMGFKMSHTARIYNVTVNHRRQILSSKPGHPARWNDKTAPCHP